MMLRYLATPYTLYPAGITQAYIDASRLAAALMCARMPVYSPIAHMHSLATFGKINPLDHSIWLPFDEVMMAKCDSLLVAHMAGWRESRGIAHEVAYFERHGKPIFDIDPVTLTITLRESANLTDSLVERMERGRGMTNQPTR